MKQFLQLIRPFREMRKIVALCLVMVMAIIMLCGITAGCKSSKSATMYPNKKYKSSKVVKSNISVRGTNKENGSTYRSY